jgi:putative nucleotidyltransferase with HDIG domain
MRIASELRLAEAVQSHLYYALLLKDAGWTNSSPVDLHLASRQAQQTREAISFCSELGGNLVRLMGLAEHTATAIGGLYEHWNGRGNPVYLKGEQIPPLTSRIMLVAQTLDVLFGSIGQNAALAAIAQRSGLWFDSDAVRAAQSLAARDELWTDMTRSGSHLRASALQMEPNHKTIVDGQVTLDAICRAFAAIIDTKSPFTFNHSVGVANTAMAIARKLGLTDSRIVLLRNAALLHDLGKMAIPNAILQKTGELEAAEWQLIRSHPEHTWRILRSVRGFEEMSEIAASHHERLDGSGYFRGLGALQLSIETRILAVADMFDALVEQRPYRNALPVDEVVALIRKESPHRIDPACVEALEQSAARCDLTRGQCATLVTSA